VVRRHEAVREGAGLLEVSEVKLSTDKGGDLRSFTPRMSRRRSSRRSPVRGWNPGDQGADHWRGVCRNSSLGSQNAVTASGNHGNDETFTVDHPIWSKEEADALAKARLRDLNLTFMTGEAETTGNAKADIAR